MKKNKTLALALIGLWLFSSCGSGSGGGNTSQDFSKLTYPQAVALNTQKGLASTQAASNVATTYSTLLGTNIDATTDPTTLQAAMDGFADSISTYDTLINDLVALNHITFSANQPALIVDKTKSEYTDPSGVDTLTSATNALLAKKKECDDLFAKVPKLPSSPSDFDKLAAAQKCMREFEAVAAEQSFDAAVSDVGGLASGGAAGAAIVYFGGTLVSGGSLLIVTAAGFVGSRVVGALWNACKPSSGSKLVLKDASTGGSCAFSHAQGNTGDSLLLQAVGTGTLEIFIDGCAPVTFSNITIANGQGLTVSATCEPLDDNMDPNVVDGASLSSNSQIGTLPTTTCDQIVGVTTMASPANPAPGQSVTVTVNSLPPAQGCSIAYTVSGTDGYHQADTLTTGTSGTTTFTVPGAATSGIVDTVVTTEQPTNLARTITYTFF